MKVIQLKGAHSSSSDSFGAKDQPRVENVQRQDRQEYHRAIQHV